ncbi:hypothetical protein LTSEADE_5844 [Salmonella enterica subsp. enterica serovar Adelaide str. A4-669]|uniref:Uncharacterized protein n=1 Tax=Salmonella enterica subsp. enterica serovar Adelaide str. A4-669 TaxID=913063 RepID=A0A6C8GF17_SALET|nr:hypothetical protein LTSEADE_5844 [Salmonella enterica subsp. enterica serovar Adelaide str. A4-669]
MTIGEYRRFLVRFTVVSYFDHHARNVRINLMYVEHRPIVIGEAIANSG